ncbi:MAG: acyl-CoA thioesterase [Deltaproteobacteria bacterium]|nr:acyl-CoA thioesterase [Deltaproteobacteria bacterium]
MADGRRTATVRFAVPFADVDAMQIVWHGNYLKYFDLARDRLYCDAGLDLYQVALSSGVVFPVIRSETKHIRPLRFRDEATCTATLLECEIRLVVEFEIRLAKDGQLCAKGRTEQAAVRFADNSLELRVPEDIRRALGTVRDAG